MAVRAAISRQRQYPSRTASEPKLCWIRCRAGVPCYWIVNLRDRCVEVYGNPDGRRSEYRSVTRATGP